MTFNRLDLITLGYESEEANNIIRIISKHTPCEAKTVLQSFIKNGVEVCKFGFVIEVKSEQALMVCNMKLSNDHIGTKTARWSKLKKILMNIKEKK